MGNKPFVYYISLLLILEGHDLGGIVEPEIGPSVDDDPLDRDPEPLVKRPEAPTLVHLPYTVQQPIELPISLLT